MTLDSSSRPGNIPPAPQEVKPPACGIPSASTALETLPEEPEQQPYTRLELWLHRFTVTMFIFLCAIVGLLLIIIPWRPEWTDNHLLLAYPGLRAVVAHGFVRGLCSGLGVIDIWIGFREAVHYEEGPVRPS